MVAREEGVGVLQAAAEGEVGALGVGGEAAHLVLTVGQDLGHGGRGVGAGLRRGAGGGLAAGPALAQQGSRRKDEVMQHPGLRSQAGPPPPRLRLPGRWAGGGGGGGGGDGDRAGAVRGGRGWRRRQERNDDEHPTAAERGRRGAVEVGRAPAEEERRGGRGADRRAPSTPPRAASVSGRVLHEAGVAAGRFVPANKCRIWPGEAGLGSGGREGDRHPRGGRTVRQGRS